MHRSPKRSTWKPAKEQRLASSHSCTISCSSLSLHLTIVLIHLTLVGVWAKNLEHRLVFSLEHQRLTSFLITAIATTFGTLYYTLLVFVTQTLAMRQNVQMERTLTATHDNAAAWAGLGAAMLHVWNQKAVPASVLGVLTTCLYLEPARLELEQQRLGQYGSLALAFLPFVGGIPTPGLSNGILYDVLDTNGLGTATVEATALDITCGSVPGAVNTEVQTSLNITSASHEIWPIRFQNETFDILSTQAGIISTGTTSEQYANSIFLYSTIPIVDSNNNHGTWWGMWFNAMPPSSTPLNIGNDLLSGPFLTVADQVIELPSARYLIQELKLLASDSIGHIAPISVQFTVDNLSDGGLQAVPTMGEPSTRPFLLQGDAKIVQLFPEARLDLSIFAASTGKPMPEPYLTRTCALAVLSLLFALSRSPQTDEGKIPMDGTGLLHLIWLYRNHPELETLLEQVEDPTDGNLRRPGMLNGSAGEDHAYRSLGKQDEHFLHEIEYCGHPGGTSRRSSVPTTVPPTAARAENRVTRCIGGFPAGSRPPK
ncbi:hypothetical protein DFH09DRAFT_1089463 [Mycena vulgaris]|nr:hypothetical protein DFH09DRAFT_1089463 [Mycena vulgaris]